MVSVHDLIAAISPDVYCDSDKRDKVKKLVKEKGYLKAADEAKPVSSTDFDLEEATYKPAKSPGFDAPRLQNKLVYDSPAESLEPIYFYLLDFMNGIFRGSKNVTKITDNFIAAPGSAQFSEIGMKATKMQEEAMKALGSVNTVLKSILNILYDLREFKIRLGTYDEYKSKDESTRKAALLALKQIYLDSVDIKRGNSAVKVMAQQFDFVTLIDAFMTADTLEEAEKLDLNDRVKRIIVQRIGDFRRWIDESDRELRKRFDIEKRYLQSQANAIKLYARWVKPYLKAAQQLEQRASPTAALVTQFNTSLLELTLMGQAKYDPKDDVDSGNLPKSIASIKREYYAVVIIEFNFRGRSIQGSYLGRTEITFTAYGLNKQEIDVLKKEIDKDDVQSVLSLIEGATDDSISQIWKDIEEFLGPSPETIESLRNEGKKDEEIKSILKEKGFSEKEIDDSFKKAKPRTKPQSDDSNPFSALFSFFKSDKKEKEKKEEDTSKGIRPDDIYEKIARSQAILDARDKCTTIFDVYKKAHQMPAYP